MYVFLIVVFLALVANLYILYRVSVECWPFRRKNGVVEKIPSDPPVSIAERRSRLTPDSERSA